LAFFAFSPEHFDAEMKVFGVPITSYTAATAMTPPSVELLLARRIRANYQRRGRKVTLGLLEFTPHSMTHQTVKFPPFRRAEQQGQAEFLDLRTLADLAMYDPDEAAHVMALSVVGADEENRVNGVLGELLLGTQQRRAAGRGLQKHLQDALESVGG